jgi:hypothetical protein
MGWATTVAIALRCAQKLGAENKLPPVVFSFLRFLPRLFPSRDRERDGGFEKGVPLLLWSA